MSRIVIPGIKGVFTNGDTEDIPSEYATVLKNLRPINGLIEKTFGFGTKINTAVTAAANRIFTYIHDSLTSPADAYYLGITVNDSTKVLTVYYWTGSAWANITAAFTVTGTFYHKDAVNPVFMENGRLRVLPGNTGEADGNHESKGLWVGYIDRDYHDEQYSPTAGFYGYSTPADKPTHVLSRTELSDFTDSSFAADDIYYYKISAVYDGVQESLLSAAALRWEVTDTKKWLKIQTAVFTASTYSKRITALKLYRKESGSADDGIYKLIHTINLLRKSDDVLTDTDGGYNARKHVYVPGLSTYTFSAAKTYKLEIDGTVYDIDNPGAGDGVEEFDLTSGDITADKWDEDYSLWTDDETSEVTGCWLGYFYIPALTSYNFDAGKNYKIVHDGTDYNITNPGAGAGSVLFQYDGVGSLPYAWDEAWELWEQGGGAALTSGADGGYLSHPYIPGLTTYDFSADATYSLDITTYDTDLAINNPGAGTGSVVFEFTGAQAESERTDQGWALNNEAETGDDGCYAGYNTVIVSEDTTADEYVGGVLVFGTGTTQVQRVVDKNYGKAVHFEDSLADQSDVGWWLLSVAKGLYIATVSGDNVYYSIYDNGLAVGAEHPLLGEVSTKVNGKFAQIIAGRLWQANVVLDPGGENEAHEDWVTYSEAAQYDVTPVSNVQTIPDREGGAITGLQEVFGRPVVTKKQAIVIIGTGESLTPPWAVTESAHNIGNLAPEGIIEVMGNLYVCSNDGIYELRPNNLAETDQTPTERLRISEPINDTYIALTEAQKVAIISSYDLIKSEIIFTLNTETWAYSTVTQSWREIYTGITAAAFGADESGQVMAYQTSDKKIYSLDEPDYKESVAVTLKLKTFVLCDDVFGRLVRCVRVTYKSDAALTLKVYSESDVESGNIEYDIVYYVNGYTTFVYNGVSYTDGDSVTGVAGITAYTTTGSGTVQIVVSKTLPASAEYFNTYDAWVNYRTTKCTVEITGAASASNTTQISGIIIMHD